MERRVFIGMLTGGLLAAPLAAEAQSVGKMPRIGYLSLFSRSDPWGQRGIDAFRHGLRDLGYVEGQTIALEYRWAEEKPVRLPDLAAELVHLKLDVIVAPGSQAAQAAKQATATIPIVMVAVTDPVTAGLVPAIARPGGKHHRDLTDCTGACGQTASIAQGGRPHGVSSGRSVESIKSGQRTSAARSGGGSTSVAGTTSTPRGA